MNAVYRIDPAGSWKYRVHYVWRLTGQDREERVEAHVGVRIQAGAPVEGGLLGLRAVLEEVERCASSPGAPQFEVGDEGQIRITPRGHCTHLHAARAGEIFMAPLWAVLPQGADLEWTEDLRFFLPGLSVDKTFPVSFSRKGNESYLGQECLRIAGGYHEEVQGPKGERARYGIDGSALFSVAEGQSVWSDLTIRLVRKVSPRGGTEGGASKAGREELEARLKAELQPDASLVDSGGFLLR